MNPQTCPFCHTADKVPEMTLALKQKDLEIKKRDEEIASLQSQVLYINLPPKRKSIFLMKNIIVAGPENLKKSRPKKLVKSNKSISWIFFNVFDEN